MGGLDTFVTLEVDPQQIRGRLPVGAFKPERESGQDAFTGTRNCYRRREADEHAWECLSHRLRRPSPGDRSKENMRPNHRRCRGIDVHKNSVTVCVLASAGESGAPKKRKFRTYSRDLPQLRGWLKKLRGDRDRDGVDGAVLAGVVELAGRRHRLVRIPSWPPSNTASAGAGPTFLGTMPRARSGYIFS
jgi:hypothetical protein